jgi:starch synthase
MSLKVSFSTWSKFHFFQLARYFYEAGALRQVFTNIPRMRLIHEGIPQPFIESNPFPALLNYGLKYFQIPCPAAFEYRLIRTIDESQQSFIARRLLECDAFVALSGAGLIGGRMTQRHGGRFVCERASTHIVWQRDILTEEFGRCGLSAPFFDERLVDKELHEYEESDKVVVPSQFVRQSFVELGVNQDKIVVIPYGVDLSTFGRDDVRRDDGEFRVVWAGQVSLRKGIPYLLDAFAKLRHPRKRLKIAGAVHTEMRALLHKLPLDEVEFLGVLDKQCLRQLYNASDVFCIASIEEGLAYVIPQALACGLPVVATANSGAMDLITEGLEGFVVPARKPDIIAERLQQLADDPELRSTMGNAALARVASLRGWREHSERYLSLISQLTGKSSSSGLDRKAMAD